MFLWVTDFYSLEKIISAFPEIVLLYLKNDRRIETGGWGLGKMDGGWVEGMCAVGTRETAVAPQVPKSWAQSGRGGARKKGG